MSNITIRKLRIDDADNLVKYGDNLKIWNNMRDYFPNPYKLEDAIGFIEKVSTEQNNYPFAISKEDQLIGIAGYYIQGDIYKHSAEIGYWVGEPFWGKGYTTQAVKATIDHAFNQNDVKRLYASVFEFNKASGRVLEKIGFNFEGKGIKSVFKSGKYLDELRYSMLNPKYFPEG